MSTHIAARPCPGTISRHFRKRFKVENFNDGRRLPWQWKLCQQNFIGQAQGKNWEFIVSWLRYCSHSIFDCGSRSPWRSCCSPSIFQAKKPMMEKMRRARINDSLNELKTLVLQLLNKDVSIWKYCVFFPSVASELRHLVYLVLLLCVRPFLGTVSWDMELIWNLIFQASRYSKMEKADILEMTVGYMRAMQRKDKHSLQQGM